jgi:hypothetical protein
VRTRLRNKGFKYQVSAIAISCICLLILAGTNVYGYASKYTYAVKAKWDNNLNFAICLFSVDREHKELFMKAVKQWHEEWPYFSYSFSNSSTCHINVYIVSWHPTVEHGDEIGLTLIEFVKRGRIMKVDIILPISKLETISYEHKGRMYTAEVLKPLSDKLFYRAALHEFGHALNLGHVDDNGTEPIDIMYWRPVPEEQEQKISPTNIRALNKHYFQ